MTLLKHKCMHKNCLFDEAVDLSTIWRRMKCVIFSVEFILSCGNSLGKFPVLKKYLEGSHREIPCVIKKTFKRFSIVM